MTAPYYTVVLLWAIAVGAACAGWLLPRSQTISRRLILWLRVLSIGSGTLGLLILIGLIVKHR